MPELCLQTQSKTSDKLIRIILFVIIVLFGFMTRTYDCQRESLKYPDFLPFTLECAMMYSYSYDIAKSGCLPKYDSSLAGMEDTSVSSQMSISLEYFLGWGFRIKEVLSSFLTGEKANFQPNDKNYNINTDFVNFIRCQLRLWISLSGGLIFLWLLLLNSSLIFSFLGGLLFAVTPAAIARATGQDIIRENFAVPLIIMSFVYYYYFLKKPQKIKPILLAVSIYLSLISWDMTILCFSLWGLYELTASFFSDSQSKDKLYLWIVIFIVCLTAGIFSSYLYAHNFLFSPLISIIIPSLITSLCIKTKPFKTRLIFIVLVVVILFLLWFFVLKNFGFSGNYSHFYSLIISKLKFGNVQPLDPSLLDFDSRILWTPALHSATGVIYWRLFHFVMPFFGLLLIAALGFGKTRKNLNANSILPIVFSIFFFILFIFMVRFHALSIPFICISIALLCDNLSKSFNNCFLRNLLSVFFMSLIAMEVHFFLNMERAYDDDFKSQLALIKELNPDYVKDKVLLADFTLSPMLKAYCNAKIILQPKFELKNSRDSVEEYLNIMFHGNENEFMEFCKKYKTDFFIFDTAMIGGGKTENLLHPWCSRYIADAKTIEDTSPVYLFYYEPEKLTFFYKLDKTEKSEQKRFEIFKVIYPEDIARAKIIFTQAKKAKGEEAKELINEAFKLNPASSEIRYFYYLLHDSNWPEYQLKQLGDF